MTDVNGTHRSSSQGANGQNANGQSADSANNRPRPPAEALTRRSRRDLTGSRRRRSASQPAGAGEKPKGQPLSGSRRESSKSARARTRKATPLVQIHGAPSHRAAPLRAVSADASRTRPLLAKAQHPGRLLPSRNIARKRSSRRSRKLPIPLLYLGRLAIVGLGIAAIGGTLLRDAIPDGNANSAVSTEVASATPPEKVVAFPVDLNQEIAPLKATFQELPGTYPDLLPKAFYVDVDTGNYVDLEGGGAIAAASTIKLPVLLAFFEEVDAGRIDPDQVVVMQPEQIAEGSGEMQVSPPGSQFTALEVATNMIVNSDNTATNMMIDLLGGPTVMNSRFEAYGLEQTRLNTPLPDLDGNNTTSARDLVHTLLLISQGDSLTMRSRDRVLNILSRTRNKSLIAAGLEEEGALTYNKTGDIGSALSDAALVDLPNGKRYAVAVLVERPTNDGRAAELIQRISGLVYQEINKAVPRLAPATVSPAPAAPAEAAPEDSESL